MMKKLSCLACLAVAACSLPAAAAEAPEALASLLSSAVTKELPGVIAVQGKPVSEPDGQARMVVNGHFSEPRSYVHDLYTPEECARIQRRTPYVNCDQILRLSPEGKAWILWTDMPAMGNYTVSGNKLKIEITTYSEMGSPVIFVVAPDFSSMRDSQGNVWKLDNGS